MYEEIILRILLKKDINKGTVDNPDWVSRGATETTVRLPLEVYSYSKDICLEIIDKVIGERLDKPGVSYTRVAVHVLVEEPEMICNAQEFVSRYFDHIGTGISN